MIRVEVGTEISRPVDEVFAYVDDPTNLPEWNSIVEEATPSETPVRVGTKITQRGKFLGRKIDSVQVVTEHVLNQRIVVKTDKPFPLTITNRFEAAGGGTKLTTIGEAEIGGFFKVGEPIVARIAKKQIQAALDTMKELLEARTPAEMR